MDCHINLTSQEGSFDFLDKDSLAANFLEADMGQAISFCGIGNEDKIPLWMERLELVH